MTGIDVAKRLSRVECRHLTGAGLSDTLSRPHVGAPEVPEFRILGLRLGDYGGGLNGTIHPAVKHLPRANEDPRAGHGLAVPGNKQVHDVAVAGFRSGQHAKDREVLRERDARAARVSR